MTNRIPPSLNWLIDKRARIAGEIEKTKQHLRKAKSLIKDLEDLETKLNAIDTTLDLHHIKIDVSLIAPINSQEVRINLPYGELKRSILTCIRLYQVNGPVSKDLIEKFVLNKFFDFKGDKIEMNNFKRSVHKGLGNLHRLGYLTRHHCPNTTFTGLWTLSDNYKID